MNKYRTERDAMGQIQVPDAQLWGAQTQRSLENFHISLEKIPAELIAALAIVKRASAKVNMDLALLDKTKGSAIIQAIDEILNNKHANEFPLSVWQTGSGTQSNMNMNEVIANRASELLGGQRGESRLIHPNDDVNKSQSSNDVFPTAMHVAAMLGLHKKLLPELTNLQQTLEKKPQNFAILSKLVAHIYKTPLRLLWDKRFLAGRRCWRKAKNISRQAARIYVN